MVWNWISNQAKFWFYSVNQNKLRHIPTNKRQTWKHTPFISFFFFVNVSISSSCSKIRVRYTTISSWRRLSLYSNCFILSRNTFIRCMKPAKLKNAWLENRTCKEKNLTETFPNFCQCVNDELAIIQKFVISKIPENESKQNHWTS